MIAACFYSFESQALGEMLERSDELNSAFSAMLNANLAQKLVRSNESR